MRAYRVVALVGLTLWTGKARATDSPIALSYEAPWECPNRDQFWRQLRARSKRLTTSSPDKLALAVDARISGDYSRYHGHLTLVEADNSIVERDVAGSSCVDVCAALALITAVTLDASRANARPGLSVTARQMEPPKRIAIGVVAGIRGAVAPSVVPTTGLSLSYHDRTRFGSPEFRIEGLFAWSRWQPVYDGSNRVGDARFLWFAARSTACPFQVQVSSITVGPCALIELGALEGEGRIRSAVQSKTGWWLAPGALLNWSVQAEPVWVRLAVGGVLPVIQNTFRFNPKPEVFQAHSFGLTAELELAWAF